jgi:hypothetical protein
LKFLYTKTNKGKTLYSDLFNKKLPDLYNVIAAEKTLRKGGDNLAVQMQKIEADIFV